MNRMTNDQLRTHYIQAVADFSVGSTQASDELSATLGILQPKCVKFRNLPFYETLKVLVEPAVLSPINSFALIYEESIIFSLSSQEVHDIRQSCCQVNGKNNYNVKVLMRFARNNLSWVQPDSYPDALNIMINGIYYSPYEIFAEKHQHDCYEDYDSPLDVTSLLTLSHNTANKIRIIWCPSESEFAAAVYLVKTLTSDDLFTKLLAKGVRSADYTQSVIKSKFEEDSEIITTAIEMSLICPLSKKRVVTPCLSEKCNHLQCFDAVSFLKLNEKSCTWKCPICDSLADFDQLVIDGFFREILSSKELTGDEIRLLQDGSWENSGNNKAGDLDTTIDVEDNDTILIDDSGVFHLPEQSIANISISSTDDSYFSLPSTPKRLCCSCRCNRDEFSTIVD